MKMKWNTNEQKLTRKTLIFSVQTTLVTRRFSIYCCLHSAKEMELQITSRNQQKLTILMLTYNGRPDSNIHNFVKRQILLYQRYYDTFLPGPPPSLPIGYIETVSRPPAPIRLSRITWLAPKAMWAYQYLIYFLRPEKIGA